MSNALFKIETKIVNPMVRTLTGNYYYQSRFSGIVVVVEVIYSYTDTPTDIIKKDVEPAKMSDLFELKLIQQSV